MYFNATPPNIDTENKSQEAIKLLNYIQEIRAETEVCLSNLQKQMLKIRNDREEQVK